MLNKKYIREFVINQKCIPWFLTKLWKKSKLRQAFYEFIAIFLNKNSREYWENVWDRHIRQTPEFRFYRNKYDRITSLVPENSRVLDIGCGMGILMERLKNEKKCSVTGIDISWVAAKYVKSKNMTAIIAKMPPIPVADGMFDVVIATEFLEHFHSPIKILDELIRVLNNSGLLIVSVPDNLGHDTNKEHCKAYTSTSIGKLISKRIKNFKIEKIHEDTGWHDHILIYGSKNKFSKRYLFIRKSGSPRGIQFGGCEKQVLDWLSEIDHTKINVSLAVQSGNKAVFSSRINKKELPIEITEFNYNDKDRFSRKLFNMYSLFKNLNPTHIVCIQGGFNNFQLPDILAGYLYTRGKVFMTEHLGAPLPPRRASRLYFGLIPGLGLWWYREVLTCTLRAYFSKRIYAVSKEVKYRAVKYYHYPGNKVFVAHHGIDMDKFSPGISKRQQLRESLRIPNTDIVIISTARLAKPKCLDRLINAFDNLQQKHKDCWLLMIGDGPLKDNLRILSDQKASQKNIKFFGFQEDVSQYLKMSDIYVLPSDNEGFGIALIEAMSIGLICVATNTPGPNEILQDSINGFLVDNSEKGVYDGLRKALMLSENEKRIISIKARKTVEENFDIKARIKDTLEILGLYG